MTKEMVAELAEKIQLSMDVAALVKWENRAKAEGKPVFQVLSDFIKNNLDSI